MHPEWHCQWHNDRHFSRHAAWLSSPAYPTSLHAAIPAAENYCSTGTHACAQHCSAKASHSTLRDTNRQNKVASCDQIMTLFPWTHNSVYTGLPVPGTELTAIRHKTSTCQSMLTKSSHDPIKAQFKKPNRTLTEYHR